MRGSRLLGTLIAALGLVLAGVPPAGAAGPTPVRVAILVAASAHDGDLAVDVKGHRHVAWLEPGVGIRYGSDASGFWVPLSLASDGEASPPAIAVDAQQKAHVVWTGGPAHPGLFYASNLSGSWRVTRITSSTGTQPAIAVDPLGEVHIAVIEPAGASSVSGPLAYVTNRRGYWQRLYPYKGSAHAPTIVLDNGRHPHLVFESYSADGLVHATDAAGTWSARSISVGQDPSAAHRGGVLRIVFHRWTSTGWALFQGSYSGTWTFSRIAAAIPDEVVGGLLAPDLSIDAAGKAHVVAGDRYLTDATGSWVATRLGRGLTAIGLGPTGDRHYLAWMAPTDALSASGGLYLSSTAPSDWTIQTVTPTKTMLGPSIALGPDGWARIVHEGAGFSTPGLRHALQSTTGWQRTRFTSGTDTWPTLAVDANGASHVAFTRDKAVMYATNASGAWVETEIGRTADLYGSAQCSRIALGATGHVFVSARFYRYPTTRNVLITDRSGTWKTSDLPQSVDCTCADLAVDSSDRAHLVYVGDSGVRYVNDVGGALGVRWMAGIGQLLGASGIAIDGSGKVHVAYVGWTGLKYRTNASGSWVTSDVLDGKIGSITIIAPPGRPVRIAYLGSGDADPGPHLATRTATGWSVVRFEIEVGAGDLAVRKDGQVRLTYAQKSVGVVLVGD